MLSGYKRNGAPFSYRWGLYVGDDLYPQVYKLYFARFKQVLLAQTQNGMLDSMRRLPRHAGPEYGPTYDTLKAYLITTSNHDKSTRDFLAPGPVEPLERRAATSAASGCRWPKNSSSFTATN